MCRYINHTKLLSIYPILLLFIYSIGVKAQGDVSITEMTSENYANLKLPPLNVLYANAEKVPMIEIFEKKRQLEERLLKKEKKAWLNFVSIRGGYTYGKTDNYGSTTDITTPLFYQYTGMSQHYYNVGGNITIPLETLFDLKGKTKRQKLAIEIAEMNRLQALDNLKQDITRTYIQI
ncbi:MAG: TolC family protein, partial [Bacteroidaceae bacterium]